MSILPKSAYDIKLPKMYSVTQLFPNNKLKDIREKVKSEIQKEAIRKRILPGQKIALLVGSRGISNLDIIVRQTIDSLLLLGAEPFIIPAMGSHGGGIAEEQKKILQGYGIGEKEMDVPVIAAMDTKIIGETPDGVPVHIDKNAFGADGIVPVGRVKVHTDFDGPIESGLCKMLAIGGGKHNGCSRLHQEGFDRFSKLIPQVAAVMLEKLNIPFGVAIIENGHEETYDVEAVPGDCIMEREPQLLEISKKLMPRLQFDQIDVLIVEQIGKDITGAGMDPNITGRRSVGKIENFDGPDIKRILVLGLSAGTHNNATGCGVADFITEEAYRQMEFSSTYTNCIASGNPEAGRIPVIVKDEEEGLRAAIQTCSGIDVNDAKVVKIQDTLHLTEIQVSENMLPLCTDEEKFKIGCKAK
ncbi:lactate racemase domain-containing protein [Anaerovorax odorimutans]|uniref:Lactate racemase domain-containing protein n=1 Tax=Anaerovorax odorimutans TaxID=109327 RepID=A0ABT1RQF4_9FIRM|nr:lactate racemase domain-containing protein [Anaerovorax odorimutans]MCQ4637427.1 lactate racemase domain-containing protein [Anaerovorax odorimutans]